MFRLFVSAVIRENLHQYVQVRHGKRTFCSVTSISKTSVSRDAPCIRHEGSIFFKYILVSCSAACLKQHEVE